MIFSSVSVSTADRQSSKISNLGFLINALAIDILCFCPPLKLTPLSPKSVLYLFSNPWISLWISAILQILMTSSSVELIDPNFILFSIVSENKKTSWGTYPICDLKDLISTEFKFFVSKIILPWSML